MKTLKRILMLSVAALAIIAALSPNAQASVSRWGFSTRVGAGHHGHTHVHRGPRVRRFYRGRLGFHHGRHVHYRGGHRYGFRIWPYAKPRYRYYRGYAWCRPTFSFSYDSYGNRIRLIGSECF